MKPNIFIFSGGSLTGIVLLHHLFIPDIIKFSGETVIGVLTIIYLIVKIIKTKNEKS